MQKIRPGFIMLSLLIASNFLWAFFYYMERSELVETRSKIETQETNMKVVNFTRMFIDDVLKSKGDIDFEKRLELENAVRSIKDQEILAKWGEFVNSKDEQTAQVEVKDLLGLLVDKIVIK